MKDKEKQFKERIDYGIAYCEDTPNKQIEEIETIIKSNLAEGSFANAFARKVAIQIVEHYQPKLPEDSVVLSMEEWECLHTDYAKALYNVRQNASKETAEKILKDFKLWAREYQYKDTVVDENGERPMTNNEKLNYLYTYLCDKYKVEIKK